MISMAIKYVILPEKKTVIAILSNTKNDAYNKAMKLCREYAANQLRVYICPNMERLTMPNEFKAVVVCSEDDEFDIEEGKRRAKKRCLENYYRSLDKRVDAFKHDMKTIVGNFAITKDDFVTFVKTEN